MFEVVSQVHSRRHPLTTAVSVAVHAAVIVAAVMATAEARTPRRQPVYEVRLVAPRTERSGTPERPAPRPAARPRATPRAPTTKTPSPVPASAALTIAPGIPDAVDAAPSLPFEGITAPDGGLTVGGDGDAASDDGAPYTAGTVDTPARLKGRPPTPVYPEALRRARVEGLVRVRFVVDTTGRVERGLEVLVAADERFVQSVRASLERARFEPARVRDRAVPQLVEQSFVFRLER